MASKDITMVDYGVWGEFDNGDFDEREPFDDLFNILNFSMEEEAGLESACFKEGWEQGLGPIPEENFRELPPVSYVGTEDGGKPLIVQKASSSQTKQQPAFFEDSGASIFLNSSNCDGSVIFPSGIFQATSPISVLESNSSNSAGKSIPLKDEIAIPVRSRSKRVRRPTYNPWFVMTPLTSSPEDSHPKKKKDKTKKKSLPKKRAPMKLDENSSQQKSTSMTKKCTHCEITKTPQWREGPMGPKTLCNACGVRYRSGRLFPEYRPAASPTFVPSIHSNSHRKVIEMRKKVSTPEETIMSEMELPMSPPPPAELFSQSSYLFEPM